MPKELLPIVDRPLIQYAAEEAIAAGIDTLIFVTGRNKRAIEDHFDNNQELEMALRAKGKNEQADMVKNILPAGVECIFVRQPEQLGLGHAVLCAERAVGNGPFAVLLADDFLTYQGSGVTADLARVFATSGKTQLSVMEVNGPDISKYGVVVTNGAPGSVAGLVEKPEADKAAPSFLDNFKGLGLFLFQIYSSQCKQILSKNHRVEHAICASVKHIDLHILMHTIISEEMLKYFSIAYKNKLHCKSVYTDIVNVS